MQMQTKRCSSVHDFKSSRIYATALHYYLRRVPNSTFFIPMSPPAVSVASCSSIRGPLESEPLRSCPQYAVNCIFKRVEQRGELSHFYTTKINSVLSFLPVQHVTCGNGACGRPALKPTLCPFPFSLPSLTPISCTKLTSSIVLYPATLPFESSVR